MIETEKETESQAENKQQEQQQTRTRHFHHPREPDRYWCGTPRPYGVIGEAGDGPQNKMATCVVCVDIWNRVGTDGWLMGLS